MIFAGDIASPKQQSSEVLKKVFDENPQVFKGKRFICNFEGLVSDGNGINTNEPILYNHPSVLNSLNFEPKPVLCLANNHILDLPGQFDLTKDLLTQNDFPFCGAGDNKMDAYKPVIFDEEDKKVILFNACWDFLLYNHKNPSSGIHVAKLKEFKLIEQIKEYRKLYPDALMVVTIHWSLDMETLPFPMYRQFSQDLINNGVNVVAGAHSHCVQGGEKYKDGYIVYGLGNFMIPNSVYAGGRLNFPEAANLELAIEWTPKDNTCICHWFESKQDGQNQYLKYLGAENFEESERLKSLSAYAGMGDEEYIPMFVKQRRKKKLIPVFRSYKNRFQNRLNMFLLKLRARFAHFLAKLNLIKWQN